MLGEIQALLGVVGLDQARSDLDLTQVPDEVARYVVAVVRHTRENPGLELGASSRAAIHLLSASKAHARLDGPRLRHDRRRARRGAVRPAPPPDLPRGHDAGRRAQGRARQARARELTVRAGRDARPARTPLAQASASAAPASSGRARGAAELRRGRRVARRLGAVGRVSGRVGRRGPARDRLLDRRSPGAACRPCSSARPRPGRRSRCHGGRARRRRRSAQSWRAGGTSRTTSRSSRRASARGSRSAARPGRPRSRRRR